MNIGSLSSLATTALDTARSTFKGLAEAAVASDTTAGQGGAAASGVANASSVAATGALGVAPPALLPGMSVEASDQPRVSKDARRGTILDAYA